MIFLSLKLALKIKNALFLSACLYFYLQDIKISFEDINFYTKLSLILDTLARNSATQRTIVENQDTKEISINSTFSSSMLLLAGHLASKSKGSSSIIHGVLHDWIGRLFHAYVHSGKRVFVLFCSLGHLTVLTGSELGN